MVHPKLTFVQPVILKLVPLAIEVTVLRLNGEVIFTVASVIETMTKMSAIAQATWSIVETVLNVSNESGPRMYDSLDRTTSVVYLYVILSLT